MSKKEKKLNFAVDAAEDSLAVAVTTAVSHYTGRKKDDEETRKKSIGFIYKHLDLAGNLLNKLIVRKELIQYIIDHLGCLWKDDSSSYTSDTLLVTILNFTTSHYYNGHFDMKANEAIDLIDDLIGLEECGWMEEFGEEFMPLIEALYNISAFYPFKVEAVMNRLQRPDVDIPKSEETLNSELLDAVIANIQSDKVLEAVEKEWDQLDDDAAELEDEIEGEE